MATHREVYLGILVLALLAYSWMFKGISVPNERTRVYLSVSMIDHDSISINRAVQRFGRTTDIAAFKGKLYTDKAPGSSLLGALVYAGARLFTSADDWSIEELINLMRTWLMLPIGLIGFLLLRRLLEDLSIDVPIRDVVSLGWILGSPAFHYSTAYYGHQIVAVAFLGVLLLLRRAKRYTKASNRKVLPHYVGAGLAAGLAGLTEYQSAVPCLIVFVYVVVTEIKRPGRIVAFSLSAAPFVVLLLAYNWSAFGGPFELSYEHLIVKNIKSLHTKGIAGVSLPQAKGVFGVLFSLHRGLLTTAPMFLLVPHGLALMWRRQERSLALLVGGSFLYYLLFNFGADVWWAGWGFGPRLLVPVLAWAAIPVAYSMRHLNSIIGAGVTRGMVVCGILHYQWVHLVFPELPEAVLNPIADLLIPAMKAGVLSPNLAAGLSGVPGAWTLLPAVVLVGLVLAFVLTARSALRGRGGLKRLVLIAGTTLIPFALAVILVGPRWGEGESRRFIRWMKKLEKIEYKVEAVKH